MDDQALLPSREGEGGNVGDTPARGAFLWLPLHNWSNDLEYGMLWMTWGSGLAMVLPVVPLIMLASASEGGDTGLGDSTSNRAAASVYIMLIVAGLLFTIGSWAIKRAVQVPAIKPLFQCFHCGSDELLGMWLFTLGTTLGIPIFCVYISGSSSTDGGGIRGGSTEAVLGLLAVCVCILVCLVVTWRTYPGSRSHPGRFSRFAIRGLCLNPDGSFAKHIRTDLLLGGWLFYLGCLLVTAGSLSLLLVSMVQHKSGAAWEYFASLVDSVIFTIGAAYFVAGSYPNSAMTERLIAQDQDRQQEQESERINSDRRQYQQQQQQQQQQKYKQQQQQQQVRDLSQFDRDSDAAYSGLMRETQDSTFTRDTLTYDSNFTRDTFAMPLSQASPSMSERSSLNSNFGTPATDVHLLLQQQQAGTAIALPAGYAASAGGGGGGNTVEL